MPSSLKYALMVFSGGALYGAMVPLVHFAYDLGFNPANGMVLHNLLATLILIPLVLFSAKQRTGIRAIKGKDFLGLAAMSVLAYGMSAGFFYALTYISSASTVTLMFQYVWMGVIIQAAVTRKLPNRWMMGSVVLVLVGTVLTTGIAEEGLGSLNVPGVLFGLLSALSYALFLFFGTRVAATLPPLSRTTIITALRLIIALALAPGFFAELPPLPLTATVGVLMAITGIIGPILLFQVATPHLPVGITTIMTSSELPCSIVLAWLLVGEHVSPLAWFGVALVLGGIVLSQTQELFKAAKCALKQRTAKEHP